MTRTDQALRSLTLTLVWVATLTVGLGAGNAPAHAEPLFGEPLPELAAPPPPSFSVQNLIALSGGSFSSLRLGIDPATLSLGSDGVVRYALVALPSSGKASGLYEGIRCATAEVKLYARFNADSGWVSVKDPQWQSLYETGPSKHSLRLARAGICAGASANSSVQQMIKDLQGEAKQF